ncbi:hypothetical protein B0H63DRAFT_138630 [Podospora didyma]|uniref:Uncharacterized protein n=1 Tax=Podospora didyma TaxID=330526 RepID=A0AAE0NRZ6_9PEZI|nr:hypothetical protein B0H63DRAFT_138630 [Podospora didyma]
MAPFSRSPRESWHRQLITSNAQSCIFGSQPFETFPFGTLRQATDSYIVKKKLVPNTPDCDSKLVDLVLDHAEKENGVKDIAVLACLHALSRSAGSSVLVSLREEYATVSANPRFLRCLILSHYANPELVPRNECQAAEALMQLLTGPDFLGSVRLLFQSLVAPPNPFILSVTYLSSILKSVQFEPIFRTQLDTLQHHRKYMSLHNAVSWLVAISNLPQSSMARMLMTSVIPYSGVWTAWKPNYLRLVQWEGGKFTKSQRERLCRIFDLEGPDTSGHSHPALIHSSPACFEFIHVRTQDPGLLHRLLRLLDNAQRIPGGYAVDLFIYLFVDNSNPIDDHLLSLAEAILDTKSDQCIQAILQWLSNLIGFNNRMVALTKILPMLESHTTLQDILGADISNDVVEVMLSAQSEYITMLETGMGENLAMNINALGKAVVTATWIWPNLPPELPQNLERLPSQETLHEIFDSLQSSQAPTKFIKDYLKVAVGGMHGDAATMLAAIRRDIKFWGNGVDSDRAHLAVAISNLSHINGDVHDACLQQILVEDLILVRDISPTISADSDSSCVDFARLLARRVLLGRKIHDCWYGLLFSLLLQRADDLLVWSAEELPIGPWFRWLEDVRLLFPEGGRLAASDLGFTPLKYTWWDLLASKYMDALRQLEVMHKRHGRSMRWLWFQEVPDIVVLLDRFQNPNQPSSPLEGFILSCVQPSPHVIRLACTSLSALSSATPKSQMAYQSLYTRHKQNGRGWPKGATEALAAAWRESHGISQSDQEGLRAFASLMGLKIPVDDKKVHAARSSLMRDHGKLMAMAQSLEEMRSQLRSHDGPKTSAFLRELAVDDEEPVSLSLSIPGKLSGCIEKVGEQQWELSFPLTKLPSQTKRAAGIDNTSRLLLVRVSFLKQQPAFCIHLYPNDDGGEGNHGLWHVKGDMPDGRVCWAKPTLFIYLLSRALCTFFLDGRRPDLESVHGIIFSILEDPAAHCIVCFREMGCKLWRPTVCSGSCSNIIQRAPLEVRAASLVSDPAMLDFLLTCIHAAAANSGSNLLPDCPLPNIANLCNIINSLPALPATATSTELLSQIRGSADRELLLTWMSVQFRGCLLSAPTGRRIPAMPGVVQFLMLNSDPARERSLVMNESSSNNSEGGNVMFYAPPPEHLWRLLTEGICTITVDPAGAAPGVHIQLMGDPKETTTTSGSSDPGQALAHAQEDIGGAWRNSAMKDRKVLLACESVTPSGETGSGSASLMVVVRYIFLCPPGFVPPHMRVVGDAFRKTFEALRAGTVLASKGGIAAR